MKYTLTAPLFISSRLLPAVEVGDAILHLSFKGRSDEGRATTHMTLDKGAVTLYDGPGPSSGVYAEPDIREMFVSALGFLSHDAETYGSRVEGPKEWLFNPFVAEWAYMNDDDISVLAMILGGE